MIHEDNGMKKQKQFNNSANPWPQKLCLRGECFVCDTNEITNSMCWKCGVTHRITCIKCSEKGTRAQYEGESGRSCFSRGKDHLTSLRKHKKGEPLPEHNLQHQPNQHPTYHDKFQNGADRDP